MIKRTCNIRGQIYRLTTWGQPQAQAWLFLHGFMGSAADFAPIAAELNGYRICLDLIGFGPQAPTVPARRLSMVAQITDLTLILAELGVTQVKLVGYSMGGRLALGFTLAQPQLVPHLYLESSTAGLADRQQREQRQRHDHELAVQLRTTGLPAFVAVWEQLPLFASQRQMPPIQQHRMRQQRLQQNPENLAASLEQMGTGSQPNFWSQLPQMTTPTTLIVGGRDQKFYQIGQRLRKLIPKAKLVVLTDAGHNTHFEVPEQFINLLKDGC